MKTELEKLSNKIVNFSLAVQKNQNIYIKYKSLESIALIDLICQKISELGAFPHLFYISDEQKDLMMSQYKLEDIDSIIKQESFEYSFYDSFLSIGYNNNFVSSEKKNADVIKKLKIERNKIIHLKNNKNWLLLNYPSLFDAPKIGMTYNDFYKYSMEAMIYDFTQMLSAINELQTSLCETKQIHIIGDNVNLIFNKTGIPAVSLLGKVNLPDGEIYTAPTKYSTNGYIKYNVPSPKDGKLFQEIYLELKDGKVVYATCKNEEKTLNEIISIDEGASYIGEFAFGFNPMITKIINDILYDEKMPRSFHIALGKCYSNASNENNSSLHWDMIYKNEEKNFCNVYFDDKLIQQNGLFVPRKLKRLNGELND